MFKIFENKDSRTTAEKQEGIASLVNAAILASDAAAENSGLNLIIASKCLDIACCLNEYIIKKYCLLSFRTDTNTLKSVLRYLSFIEDDIKQFSKSTPATSGIKNIKQED